jgi:hypothetical protein
LQRKLQSGTLRFRTYHCRASSDDRSVGHELSCPLFKIADQTVGELPDLIELDRVAFVDLFMPDKSDLMGRGCYFDVTVGTDGVVGSIQVLPVVKAGISLWQGFLIPVTSW